VLIPFKSLIEEVIEKVTYRKACRSHRSENPVFSIFYKNFWIPVITGMTTFAIGSHA